MPFTGASMTDLFKPILQSFVPRGTCSRTPPAIEFFSELVPNQNGIWLPDPTMLKSETSDLQNEPKPESVVQSEAQGAVPSKKRKAEEELEEGETTQVEEDMDWETLPMTNTSQLQEQEATLAGKQGPPRKTESSREPEKKKVYTTLRLRSGKEVEKYSDVDDDEPTTPATFSAADGQAGCSSTRIKLIERQISNHQKQLERAVAHSARMLGRFRSSLEKVQQANEKKFLLMEDRDTLELYESLASYEELNNRRIARDMVDDIFEQCVIIRKLFEKFLQFVPEMHK